MSTVEMNRSAERDDRPTRELSPLEVEELVEPERRYKPEPGDLDLLDLESTDVTPRARKRTVRMRVFNFKPLTRPHADEVTATLRDESPRSRLASLLASLFVPSRFDD